VERDIIIVDEVIGAGDAHFVEKAAKRVRNMFERAKILVLATHAGHIAAQLCNRAIWMDSGKIVMTGDPDAVWKAYLSQP
jgi:ABC-type polysaccharide/polyol phosphate transport system ATPase subunit